jgi:hypothetical protein
MRFSRYITYNGTEVPEPMCARPLQVIPTNNSQQLARLVAKKERDNPAW